MSTVCPNGLDPKPKPQTAPEEAFAAGAGVQRGWPPSDVGTKHVQFGVFEADDTSVLPQPQDGFYVLCLYS